MKKVIVLLLFIYGCSNLLGQTSPVVDTTAVAKFNYCELVGTAKLFSKKVTVELDFGQASKALQDNRYKDPATGQPVVFNSMVDALNFMGNNGWEFVQAYTIGDAQNGYVYHFMLKKPVMDSAKIN